MLVHYASRCVTTMEKERTASKPEGRAVQFILVALAFHLINYMNLILKIFNTNKSAQKLTKKTSVPYAADRVNVLDKYTCPDLERDVFYSRARVLVG